jgi:HSP20 family protein
MKGGIVMFNLTPWRKNRPAISGPGADFPLAHLRDEMDAMFDRFLSHWPWMQGEPEFGRFWGLDIEEKDGEVVIKAEAPGFEAKDFDVHVSGNVLTIRAEKKQERKEKRNGGQFEERRFGSFERTVNLPPGADPDKVDAKYRNGILEVHIAQSEEAKGKRIPVKG